MCGYCRYQYPRGLRRGSAPARFRGLQVRILPGEWTCVSCDCPVLSGAGLFVGLITPVSEFDCEASTMKRPWPIVGRCSSKRRLFVIRGEN